MAFRLYDTFGFPLDLTQDALREQGRDGGPGRVRGGDGTSSGARARAAWAGSGEAATERVWFEIKEKVGATEFLGYSHRDRRGRRSSRWWSTARRCDARRPGTEVAVVLNQTPFYGESGGQVGDTGVITGPDGLRIVVTDTQKKLGDLFVHLGRVEAGEARVGDAGGGRRWIMRGAARSARTTRRRICCTRRCGGGSARMSRRRAA